MSSSAERWGCLGIVVGAALFVNTGLGLWKTGSGSVVCVVWEAPKSGFFKKSTEAVLARESAPGSNVFYAPKSYAFSSDGLSVSAVNKELGNKLREASKSREIVVVNYDITLWHSWFTRDTGNLVTSIEFTGKYPLQDREYKYQINRQPKID